MPVTVRLFHKLLWEPVMVVGAVLAMVIRFAGLPSGEIAAGKEHVGSTAEGLLAGSGTMVQSTSDAPRQPLTETCVTRSVLPVVAPEAKVRAAEAGCKVNVGRFNSTVMGHWYEVEGA